MQPYVGQIISVGFNFAPQGWALCNGQLLSISEYEALYNLIGTTYGGDGVQTFALPNLMGRVPLNAGTSPGSGTYVLGQISGSESITLTSSQIAPHSHSLLTSASAATSGTPGPQTVLGVAASGPTYVYGSGTGNVSLAPASIGSSGGSQPHENRQPFQTISYIIALYGIYPTQN